MVITYEIVGNQMSRMQSMNSYTTNRLQIDSLLFMVSTIYFFHKIKSYMK